MIQRANELSREYEKALADWYRYDDDPTREAALGRLYYRARYRLRNHVEMMETVVATYDIFGRIY
jgi:hypothetical protein